MRREAILGRTWWFGRKRVSAPFSICSNEPDWLHGRRRSNARMAGRYISHYFILPLTPLCFLYPAARSPSKSSIHPCSIMPASSSFKCVKNCPKNFTTDSLRGFHLHQNTCPAYAAHSKSVLAKLGTRKSQEVNTPASKRMRFGLHPKVIGLYSDYWFWLISFTENYAKDPFSNSSSFGAYS